MAERLKDMFFTTESIGNLVERVTSVHPSFDEDEFIGILFDDDWPARALKEKMHHTARCLWGSLHLPYPLALEVLKQVAPHVKGFEALTFPDFVELYGQDDWDLSMDALGFFTLFGSAEFAVRPFLKSDFDRGLSYLHRWADDPSPEVRRLASEGSRPRLPWGMALPMLKADPLPVLPVLEKLKGDPTEAVRRSVANHLNDISKDHPQVALEVCERWYGESPEVDWVVRHACRGLLKKGNQRAMALFGFGDPAMLTIEQLDLATPVSIGENLAFSFEMTVLGEEEIFVRIAYAIDFVKARGNFSRKVFHLTEKIYAPGTYSLKKTHSLVDRSTRKHYPGQHNLMIQVNGEMKASLPFIVR